MSRYNELMILFFGRLVGIVEEMIFILYIYTHTHTHLGQGGWGRQNPPPLCSPSSWRGKPTQGRAGWFGRDGVGTFCYPYFIYNSCSTID
jgi:hypothetical protein